MRSRGADGDAMWRSGWCAACALAMLAAGCGTSTCDRSEGEQPQEFTEARPQEGVYATSAPDGELLYFPGGTGYALRHHLGAQPQWFQIYLSFERYGTRDGGSLAQAAGNQAEVTCVDDEHLVVINRSCSDYWLRVVAGGARGGDGSAGGAAVASCYGDGASP